MLLEGKNAVIYGGGGAIGGAVARTFAREGARVFLAGRTLTNLDRVALDIAAAGGVAEIAEVDVLDEQAVNKHIDVVAATAGSVDIGFNAAGFRHVQGPPLAELSIAEYAHPIHAYTRANFLTAKAVARHMVRQRSGVILTLSTAGARMSGAGFLGYGVTCAAIEGFSRILSGELGPYGIRVVCLRSHAIPETMTTSHVGEVFGDVARRSGAGSVAALLDGWADANHVLKRLPTLAEIADYAAFAASDRASAMTATIANLSCGTLVD